MTSRFKNFRRKLFGFLSFSTALFIFQACYGAPQDQYEDVLVKGTILSDTTNQPVSGIKVIVNSDSQFAMSDSTGSFSFYVPSATQYHLLVSDADTAANGYYSQQDTVLGSIPENGLVIRMTSAN